MAEQQNNLASAAEDSMQIDTSLYRDVYDDTLYFVDGLVSEYDFYPSILKMFQDGNISVDLKKRYTIKAIDELWVRTIEESLVALDDVIRAPSRFIEEQEQVLPIELSRNITSRSVAHLAQHTDYISKVEGDTVTPSKILNVFREETVMTYENKFINTLLNRLYSFVVRRYDAIFKNGKSEKSTALNFSGDFAHSGVKGKLHFGIEISEDPEKNMMFNGHLWDADLDDRVIRLYNIVQGYMGSEFVKMMGHAYVKPPIMRTNPIMKNKNLRQCLALWQFIESYEGTGYEVFVQENAERMDDTYVNELYSTCALQYLIFRYKIKNDFEEEKYLDDFINTEPFRPRFVDEVKPLSADEFNIFDTQYMKVMPYYQASPKRHLSASEKRIAHAIDLALEADPIFDERRLAEARRRLEEEERLRAEEEARRLAEEEAKRLAAEEAERIRLAEEARRIAEEERLRAEEEARLAAEAEARRLAEEEARRIAEEEARRIAEEEALRLAEEERLRAEEEARRLAEEEAARRARNRKITRKNKKKIRRAAEIKAEAEDVELSRVFDYDEYTRFLNQDGDQNQEE